jgi:hypothetical protein
MMLRILALFLTAMCGLAATDRPATVAGIYEANMVVKGTAGRKVTLTLQQDGKATLRSELVGKDVVTNSGTWSAAGEEVRVDFEGGQPAPMVWKLRKKGRLAPKDKGGLKLSRPR